MKKVIFCLLSICFIAFTSCGDKDKDTETQKSDAAKVNEFSINFFGTYYLWTDKVNWKTLEKTYTTYENPFDFVDQIIYEADNWSMLTRDAKALLNQVGGIRTTFGYEIRFGYIDRNTNRLAVLVLCVYENSPAEKAGLKRGDMIVSVNGSDITVNNAELLYSAATVSFSRGYLNENNVCISYNENIRMNAVEMYENPILKDSIIVKGSNKIGYLCYSAYVEKSEPELIKVFSNFKSNGVTDVVLDLRYNGGGLSHTAQLLSSILAPGTAVRNKDIYLKQDWNAYLTQYFKERKEDLNEYFMDTLSVNMNLSRLFVLTTSNTASASEATIIGLQPYMNIIKIGSETHGKYYGGIILSVADLYENSNYTYSYYQNIANWGAYVMVYRYSNKNGSIYEGGIPADIPAEEFYPLYPFGDERDPFLGRAIAQITGQKYTEPRSVSTVKFYAEPRLQVNKAISGKLINNADFPKIIRQANSLQQ